MEDPPNSEKRGSQHRPGKEEPLVEREAGRSRTPPWWRRSRLHNNNKQPVWGVRTSNHDSHIGGATTLGSIFQGVDLGGAWIGSARRGLVATLEEGVFESSCKGESERRKWKSYIILSSFLILWFHYFGPVLEKVSGDMKVLAKLK